MRATRTVYQPFRGSDSGDLRMALLSQEPRKLAWSCVWCPQISTNGFFGWMIGGEMGAVPNLAAAFSGWSGYIMSIMENAGQKIFTGQTCTMEGDALICRNN